MTDQEKRMSMLDMFASSQETFEEAKKKSSEESGKRVNYLRFTQDGTYNVRILPLAPVVNANGEVLPMDRKGYEYPLRSLMLKIEDSEHLDKKNNPKLIYVNVCNAKQAFPTLDSDLIETYVRIACDLYASDTKLCEKLRSNSFSGGLKYDSRRCFYVFDCDKRGDGLQIVQLSYAQYKDLEERKLNLWNKLNKNGKNVPCPISSLSAYPLEITRKTENSKTEYSFNIDTISGVDELDEDSLQLLFDAPRLPEILYHYTRFHLEATLVYLAQLDKKYGINIVSTQEFKDCADQIKMLLPADDQSHFTMKSSESEEETGDDLEALWKRFDEICDQDLDDKSAEGQELRTSIKEYIEDNKLGIKVTRSKSNEDLLNAIEKAVSNDDEEEEEEETPAPVNKSSHKKEESAEEPEEEPETEAEEESEEEEPAEESEEEPEEEEEEETSSHRNRTRERNDDTNEPAVRVSRRGARPTRRR